MSDFVRTYAKGIRAFLGLVFLWAYSVRADGINGDEWWGLAFIIAGTLGVVDATNTPAQWRPKHRAED